MTNSSSNLSGPWPPIVRSNNYQVHDRYSSEGKTCPVHHLCITVYKLSHREAQ
jgi:hypothetical protein